MKVNFEELKNGMELRCIKNLGVFKRDNCYVVNTRFEHSVTLGNYYYHLNKQEFYDYFEVASTTPLSEQLSHTILDVFENCLDSNNIVIPDTDRNGDEGEACIYGMTYANMLSDIANILSTYVD